MSSSERQPLLPTSTSHAHAGSMPLRPMTLDRRRRSLQESASTAVAADFKRRVPLAIQARLVRLAAAVKERTRGKRGTTGVADGVDPNDFVVESDGEGGPTMHLRRPARSESDASSDQSDDSLVALFDNDRTSESSNLIASSLASSYGAISSTLLRRNGNASTRNGTQDDESNADVASSPSHSSQRRGSLSSKRSPRLTHKNAAAGVGVGGVTEDEESELTAARNELIEELVNPIGKYRRVWLLVVFLFLLYDAVVIPFLLAFQQTWHSGHVIIILFVIGYVGDLFFCLDVLLYFFTPYTRDGMYERNLADIRTHYVKTWFFPDLIASFPFDLLFYHQHGIKYVLIVRFTRFIRFLKYDSYFEIWENWSTRYPQGIRFLKLMLGLLLILHWLACFWFYCGHEYGFGATTWLPAAEFEHADVTTQYIGAWWWSTNIITQVGGDPGLPETNFERIADFFVAFIAVFVVAIIIGTVTELVSELSADASELRNKLSVLSHFMYARRLPDELQDRIRNYYFTLWNRRGITDGDTTILAELPSNLRTEVSLIMNKDILNKVPIFQASSPGFINSLVLHLRPQTYGPKEVIVKQGDSGSEMYFISRGQVNVVADGRIVGRIGEGGVFGEIAVLQENTLRTASIVAVQFCDVFVLTHEDLQALFRVFPAERYVINHIAETRRAKDLLRKTLADPAILVRESQASGEPLGTFEAHPVLVNLLIDLFQPLDLRALAERNCPNEPRRAQRGTGRILTIGGLRVDENGEVIDDDATPTGHSGEHSDDDVEFDGEEGVIFSPRHEAHTLYFIGKGCIDIFAHPHLEEEMRQQENSDGDDEQKNDSDEVDSDASTEPDGDTPQHVIRLTEGHFFGAIAPEHYRVSAVVPHEYRHGPDEAIIFALTAHDLPRLHEYFREYSAQADAAGRESLKRTLLTWLQRHRTPLDYVKSMINLNLATSPEGRAAKNWRALLHMLLRKPKPQKHGSGVSTAAQTPTHGASLVDMTKKAPEVLPQAAPLLPPRTTRINSGDDITNATPPVASAGETPSDRKRPLITVSPAAEPSPPMPVQPYTSASWAPLSTEVPAPLAGSSSANPVAAAAAGSTSSQSNSNNSAPALTRPSSLSPLSPNRPGLTRVSSLGRPPEREASSALSPLLYRTVQARADADVSELLAQADYAAHTHHPVLSRITIDEGSTASSANPSPTLLPANPAANLDWLTSPSSAASATTPSSSSSSLLPPNADTIRRSHTVAMHPPASALTTARPDFRRLPSQPAQPSPSPKLLNQPTRTRRASFSQQPSQPSLLSTGSLASVRPNRASMGGHRREASGGQPFAFLLNLPQQQPAGVGGTGMTPLASPSLGSHTGSLASPASGTFTLTSPRALTTHGLGSGMIDGVASSPLQGKRGSGVQVTGGTPNRRLSIIPGGVPKSRADFLDKHLASLSSEDLMLLANKANLQLLARMQLAQQQAEAAAQALAQQQQHQPTPPPITPAPRF